MDGKNYFFGKEEPGSGKENEGTLTRIWSHNDQKPLRLNQVTSCSEPVKARVNHQNGRLGA